MAGICIEKLPHSCGSRNGMQVFLDEGDGSYNGYCFSCNTYIPNVYKDKPPPKVEKKSKEEVREEVEEISKYPCLALPDRKLKKEALEYFNIKIGVSEEDGVTPKLHYYPYTRDNQVVGYKVRLIENKRMWGIGDTSNVNLFGWEQAIKASGKKLFITEGECDAVALYQIFKEKNSGTAYASLNPPIVSLPHGAGSAARDLTKHANKIKEYFKEIVLVFDMDEAGRSAVDSVIPLFPGAISASLPAKDVNECLIKGIGVACYNAVVFNAKRPKNTRLITGNSLHEQGKTPPVFGYSWPWKHITEATRGMRLGETIYVGAAPKMGKSELVNAIAAHCIKEHNWKTFLIKPEEANVKTYKMVASKLTGKFFHDPSKDFDLNSYEDAGRIISDRLYMLNLYQHVGWDSLKADIIEAAHEGCKAIIIDPITNLTNGMDAASANVKLQEIAQDISSMALDLNVVVFIFCHLRNPDSGPPHERGGKVLSSQFAGSRAMARSCNYMFGLEGNRDPDLSPEERNMRTLVLLEDREFGEAGNFKMYWDENTGLFNEV